MGPLPSSYGHILIGMIMMINQLDVPLKFQANQNGMMARLDFHISSFWYQPWPLMALMAFVLTLMLATSRPRRAGPVLKLRSPRLVWGGKDIHVGDRGWNTVAASLAFQLIIGYEKMGNWMILNVVHRVTQRCGLAHTWGTWRPTNVVPSQLQHHKWGSQNWATLNSQAKDRHKLVIWCICQLGDPPGNLQ